jgi:hypothetical protein
LNTLNEHEVSFRPDSYSSFEEKEQSFNNQRSWEECFVQHYAILKAADDIKVFNDCVINLQMGINDTIVDELVHAIELIRSYNGLVDKIEAVKSSKWEEENSKSKKELEYRDIQNIMLMKLLDESKVQALPKITGFSCNLNHETVKEIYYIMSDKGHIKANLDDFLAVFSKTAKTVNKPIEWLILNERGTNSNRGNQTALFIFLKLMLGKISNEHLRKAKDLFIDKKGAFIKESLLKPDKSKISAYGFETPIKEIIKKADQI